MPDQPLSAQGGSARGRLQAMEESLRDYPAIVAMHEEQTERAEAERDEAKADLHQVHLNYHHMVDVAQRYRTALERLEHLLAAPGGLTPAELQAEGRRVISVALEGEQTDATPRDDAERNIVRNGVAAGFSDRTIDALIRKHRVALDQIQPDTEDR